MNGISALIRRDMGEVASSLSTLHHVKIQREGDHL